MGIERRKFTWSGVVLLALASQLTSGCITKGDTNIGQKGGKTTSSKPTANEADAGAETTLVETTNPQSETDGSGENPQPATSNSAKPQDTSGMGATEPTGSVDTPTPSENPPDDPPPAASEEPTSPAERIGFDRGPLRLSAGANHTCGVTEAGGLKCWGSPSEGKLGFDTESDTAIPKTVPDADDVLEVSAGANHTCILVESGKVQCWGQGDYGQLGAGDDDTRYAPGDFVVDLEDVVHIDAGGRHTCALLANGTVKCWGDNALGQLGDETPNDNGSAPKSNEPITVPELTDIVNISAGESTTCAVDTEGSVWCWGDNSSYQLADNSGTTPNATRPQQLPSDLGKVEQVAVGSTNVCAVLHNKSVKCWGSTSYVFGAVDASGIFAQLDGISSAVQVISGSDFACVLLDNGGVRCVGDDGVGQLGNGSGTGSPFSSGVAQLTAGGVVGARHVCALLDSGAAKCWGSGASGQLGNGSKGNATAPKPVSSFEAAAK